jgi:hypothetical protein
MKTNFLKAKIGNNEENACTSKKSIFYCSDFAFVAHRTQEIVVSTSLSKKEDIRNKEIGYINMVIDFIKKRYRINIDKKINKSYAEIKIDFRGKNFDELFMRKIVYPFRLSRMRKMNRILYDKIIKEFHYPIDRAMSLSMLISTRKIEEIYLFSGKITFYFRNFYSRRFNYNFMGSMEVEQIKCLKGFDFVLNQLPKELKNKVVEEEITTSIW